MGFRRLPDTDAFQRVHYEAKVRSIDAQLRSLGYVGHRWVATEADWDWPERREMASWLRMRIAMAEARREFL